MQYVNHYAEKNDSHYDVKIIECMNRKVIGELIHGDDEGVLNVFMLSNKQS